MGFGDLLDVILSGGSGRKDIARTERGGFVISTVDTTDMGPETAILDANGTHPVERYGSVSAAKKGHKKWLAFIGTGKRKVKVKKLGYGDLVSAREITLRPETK